MAEPVDLLDPEYAVPGELERYERQWRDVTPDAPAGRTVRTWVDDQGVRHVQTNTEPERPPLTGPELAAMRTDAIEARLRVIEAQVGAYGRRLDAFDRTLEHLARLLHKHVNRTEGEVLVEP